ncbi:hypothetical protein AHF37_03757 [Paragonimus kellicotti]|nr:hypothetical protein AHF37_03757 [Paragonimus kellicotti]
MDMVEHSIYWHSSLVLVFVELQIISGPIVNSFGMNIREYECVRAHPKAYCCVVNYGQNLLHAHLANYKHDFTEIETKLTGYFISGSVSILTKSITTAAITVGCRHPHTRLTRLCKIRQLIFILSREPQRY